VSSGFGGQLPQKFGKEGARVKAAQPFNAVNREEVSRYVEIEDCDYFVELLLEADEELGRGEAAGAVAMGKDGRRGEWKKIFAKEYLDAEKTGALHRVVRWRGLYEGGEFAEYALFQHFD